jgi:hypothetical protein
MVVKEYKKQAGVYKVQTFGTTHFLRLIENYIYNDSLLSYRSLNERYWGKR